MKFSRNFEQISPNAFQLNGSYFLAQFTFWLDNSIAKESLNRRDPSYVVYALKYYFKLVSHVQKDCRSPDNLGGNFGFGRNFSGVKRNLKKKESKIPDTKNVPAVKNKRGNI